MGHSTFLPNRVAGGVFPPAPPTLHAGSHKILTHLRVWGQSIGSGMSIDVFVEPA